LRFGWGERWVRGCARWGVWGSVNGVVVRVIIVARRQRREGYVYQSNLKFMSANPRGC